MVLQRAYLLTWVLIAHVSYCAVPPTNPSQALQALVPQPTCIPTLNSNVLSASLSSFPSDCILAINALLQNPDPTISRRTWTWKRFPPGQLPPEGYARLPYALSPASCTIELDVLSDETAEDRFAIYTLKGAAIALFSKCVRGKRVAGQGFVSVGPKGVLALTLRPAGRGDVGTGRREKQTLQGRR